MCLGVFFRPHEHRTLASVCPNFLWYHLKSPCADLAARNRYRMLRGNTSHFRCDGAGQAVWWSVRGGPVRQGRNLHAAAHTFHTPRPRPSFSSFSLLVNPDQRCRLAQLCHRDIHELRSKGSSFSIVEPRHPLLFILRLPST